MNHRPQVMTGFSPLFPGLKPYSIQSLADLISGTVLRCIDLEQVPYIFNDFIPHLESHALLGNGFEQSAEHYLVAVSFLVACEIGGIAAQLVTRDQRAAGAHHYVVQIVADGKQFAESWIVQPLFVLFPGDRHITAPLLGSCFPCDGHGLPRNTPLVPCTNSADLSRTRAAYRT